MNISELAEKYFHDHNHPFTRPEQFGTKLFLSSLTEGEIQLKEKCLKGIESTLRLDRVERRCSRSVAEWLPDESRAKVIKITGPVATFGNQNKNGKFLDAEEALFLLEINKLELTCNRVPMSIQEAFANVRNLSKYLAYKKLALQSCKLKSPNVNPGVKDRKRKLREVTGESSPKVARIESTDDIFEKLRTTGPHKFQCEDECRVPDYYVKASPNKEKSQDFRLIINETGEFVSPKGDEKNLGVYALCSGDNVSFYKFYNTNIPIL